MQDDYLYCEAEVRAGDKNRYLADLFAPAAARPHLFALQAFNLEIANVRRRVTEPMAGEIRLQWWREVLKGERPGAGSPVAVALLDTVSRFELSGTALERIIDARAFDLAEEPRAELAALENYAEAPAGMLFQLASHVLAGGAFASYADAARPAGIAYGLATALQEHIAPQALRDHARRHLDDATRKLGALPSAARVAFLPLALVPLYLKRMGRNGKEPIAQWRRQWALWRGMRRL
jgi:phytoene synthase